MYILFRYDAHRCGAWAFPLNSHPHLPLASARHLIIFLISPLLNLILGSDPYADDAVGGCGSTGDGDVMMRFLPCFLVVERMRQGVHPTAACEEAIGRIYRAYPDFVGALVAVNKRGQHGAAAYGWDFSYSVRMGDMAATQVVPVTPMPRVSPDTATAAAETVAAVAEGVVGVVGVAVGRGGVALSAGAGEQPLFV